MLEVNPLQTEFLRVWHDFPDSRLKSIVNGVAVPDTPVRADFDRDGVFRIAFVGRLNQEHKRVFDLIKLAGELERIGTSYEISIVGSGECEPDLRQQAARYTSSGRIEFYGYLEPERILTEIYPRHHSLVLFSPSEGCPLVVQEAMAYGVVPVCTEFVGVHSLRFIRDRLTACIWACGDIASAAARLSEIAAHPDKLARMSAACRNVARSFTAETCHRQWCNALEEVVSRAPNSCDADAERFSSGTTRGVGGSRLERWLSPGRADLLRRLMRRWPEHGDGWAEWPGTLSTLDEATQTKMWKTLAALDKDANPHQEAEVASR